MKNLRDLAPDELLRLLGQRQINEREALEILRHPRCTAEIASAVAEHRRALTSHKVRELLAGFRGFSLARALNLLPTLPWTSLLLLAKEPRTPPRIRRLAERRIIDRVTEMSLGEKVALARIAHRPLFQALFRQGDGQVLVAMLDNPRIVENDLVVLLNTRAPPLDFIRAVASHSRWGNYRGVRFALVTSHRTPLPLALSVLVKLGAADLGRVSVSRMAPAALQDAAQALCEKRKRTGKGMLRSSVDEPRGEPSDPSKSTG